MFSYGIICYLKDKVYLHSFISVKDLKKRIRTNCLNVYKNSDHLDAVMKNIKK